MTASRGIALSLILTLTTVCIVEAQTSPEDVARRIADRVVEETSFGFDLGLPSWDQEGFYVVDFRESGLPAGAPYVARTELHVDSTISETDLAQLVVGLAHADGTIEVEVDETILYQGSGDRSRLTPLDYALVRPSIRAPLPVGPGSHDVVIRFTPAGDDAKVWMGFIRADNELVFEGAELRLPDGMDAGSSSRFLIQSGANAWVVPRVHLVKELRHPLAFSDWRYFTGTLLDAMYAVTDVFEDLDYSAFIERHMNFFQDNRGMIQGERRERGLLEGPFGHYFRFALLDDMGMQTVPFAERLRRKPDGQRADADREIVDRSLDHIMYRSKRLADGTWARFNPDSLTVWADDLFMGSVLLTRMASLDGNPAYLDEGARQVAGIHRRLFDPASGLYWHGYFEREGRQSSSKWGRANGWTMMAKTELLVAMPHDHPDRPAVLEAFASHAAGLLAVQSDDGRWHQVLDNPDTYLETSCTAMFTRAFAEGVTRGWLPEEGYLRAAERGWEAIRRQVRPDGQVEGIVRGTPIFYSDQEYQDHPARLNDPRGLGAVLYAAASMHNLRNR